jgi:hypothetical protein
MKDTPHSPLLATSFILATATLVGLAQDKPAASATNDAAAVRAFIDDAGPGWRSLEAADFTKVNSADDTWSWKDGVLHCQGVRQLRDGGRMDA